MDATRSRTRRPSRTTSGPMPSPPITAMLYDLDITRSFRAARGGPRRSWGIETKRHRGPGDARHDPPGRGGHRRGDHPDPARAGEEVPRQRVGPRAGKHEPDPRQRGIAVERIELRGAPEALVRLGAPAVPPRPET